MSLHEDGQKILWNIAESTIPTAKSLSLRKIKSNPNDSKTSLMLLTSGEQPWWKTETCCGRHVSGLIPQESHVWPGSDVIAVCMGLWAACSAMTPAEWPIWRHDQSRFRVDSDVTRNCASYPVDVGRAVGIFLSIPKITACATNTKSTQSTVFFLVDHCKPKIAGIRKIICETCRVR